MFSSYQHLTTVTDNEKPTNIHVIASVCNTSFEGGTIFRYFSSSGFSRLLMIWESYIFSVCTLCGIWWYSECENLQFSSKIMKIVNITETRFIFHPFSSANSKYMCFGPFGIIISDLGTVQCFQFLFKYLFMFIQLHWLLSPLISCYT